MKDRILSGWTVQRAFYFMAGGAIVVVSILDQQWVGVALGSYFTAMGLFAFGCAAGNCTGSNCKCDDQS